MKTILAILMLVPVEVFGQVSPNMNVSESKPFYRSAKVNPIKILEGNVVSAMYKVAVKRSDEGKGQFDFIIYLRSYREVMKPHDKEALVTADGLGKIFPVHCWITRYRSQRLISSIVIRMSREEFKSISFAGNVGIKIGMNSFTVSHKERHAMRQLVSDIEALTGNESQFINPKKSIKVLSADNEKTPIALRVVYESPGEEHSNLDDHK